MRDIRLDKIRGLAILVMIFDHVLAITINQSFLRYSVTRIAMPLFFVLAGHLVRRIDWKRLIPIGIIGLLLPLYVGFIDDPNVLLIYAICVPLILGSRIWIAWLTVACLTIYANGWGTLPGAYAPLGLLGLMLVGKMMDREMFSWGKYLPRFLSPLGKYPLTIYVGHVLILETIYRFTL